jgi:hypothetical protein
MWIVSVGRGIRWCRRRGVQNIAEDFEKEGGFTERLYRVRKNRKDGR